MTKFELFKFIHVLFAVIWVGGAITSGVFGARLKTAEPGHRLGYAKDMRFTAQFVFIPSAIITFLFGSLMVEEVRPVFDYDQTWIIIGNLGLILALLTAAFFLVPQIRKAIRLMESGEGPAAGAVIGRVTIVSRIVMAILVVVVWAMVTKPGL